MSQHLERALQLAERGRGTTSPNPVVGAVLVRDGAVVGEGWHERRGEAHAEVHALRAAGMEARGATLFVTLEPCSHHGATPPCVDAVLEAGVARVVVGQRDPDPESGGGLERLRDGGVEVELAAGEVGFACRRQVEAWRTWVVLGRPFVTYKVAATLDGRVTVPGSRWVSGEASRRYVHELRAQVDAVAVGMGTVMADRPRLNARGVTASRQPRRLAFGSTPLPEGSDLERRSRALRLELSTLAQEGVQSLLLEGGPTLASAFLAEDLVDKLLVFVAPIVAGDGPPVLRGLPVPVPVTRLSATRMDTDVLLEAYVHEP